MHCNGMELNRMREMYTHTQAFTWVVVTLLLGAQQPGNCERLLLAEE